VDDFLVLNKKNAMVYILCSARSKTNGSLDGVKVGKLRILRGQLFTEFGTTPVCVAMTRI
jgi:hypothetical protein